MAELRKYGVATTINFPLIDAGAADFEATPVTFAAGDTKIKKDEGASANTTNNPAHEGEGIYSLALTATEMQAARIVITVIDSATKAWEDQAIIIDTYGNASAQHAIDLDDSVRAGLTALPNAAAEAAGGLYTRGTGAGQIDQPANGQIDVNVAAFDAGAITAAAIAASAIDANALATDAVNEIARAILPQTNTALADLKFLFVAASDHVTPVTGATGTAVTRSIDGGAFGSATGTLAEIGNGIYQFDASAADMNGTNIIFRFTATGGTPGAPDDAFLFVRTSA